MKSLKVLRIVLWVLYGVGYACHADAQVFRKVTGEADIEVGARYILAAPVYQNDYALYVVTRQETTGESVKKRDARMFETDELQRIHVDNADIAMFELGKDGSNYTFRDVHNGGYLTYSTKKVSTNNTGLYTLTEEELSSVSSSLKPVYQTFKFDFSLKKTCVLTARKIIVSSGSEKNFYLLSSANIGDSFRLYDKEDVAGTLYLYKREPSPATIENKSVGDWTFRGDWTASELSAEDFSQALRIDFTGIELPEDWRQSGLAEAAFPREYVWTYVRQGEGNRLPEGWCNVIEVNPSTSSVAGCAVTAIRGGDACVMTPKYPFRTQRGAGISWYRYVPADGGWLTVGLPFAVQTCTWNTADGEDVDVERRMFSGVSDDDVVFREVKPEDVWQTGVPYLWRPLVPAEGTICFHADEVEVQTGDTACPEVAGFYASFMRRDIDDEACPVYLLDERGEKFVRAAAGSWIAPGRGYLYLPAGAGRSVRLLVRDEASACRGVTVQPGTSVPVYTLTGMKAAEWVPGTPLPDTLPCGIYVTPVGKQFKP